MVLMVPVLRRTSVWWLAPSRAPVCYKVVNDVMAVLSGVRVIEASTLLAAPLAASLLSDFGADVIKVERPVQGDPIRSYPPFAENGDPLGHKVTNRNKWHVTCDLHKPEGQTLFRKLVATADVVITNFRLETLARWQIDYPHLRLVRDNLIMLHLSAYGRTGPYRDRPGFARVVEAFSGLTYMSGTPDGPPMFSGYPLADGLGGIYGAFSVMLALFHRDRQGAGQLIDLGLYEPLMKMMESAAISYEEAGDKGERTGNVNRHVAPNNLYKCRDGRWIVLPVSTDGMFVRLCNALGLSAIVDDPGFATNAQRVKHRDDLDDVLNSVISQHNATDLLDRLREHGVACGDILRIDEFLSDPHVHERTNMVRVFDPTLGRDVVMPGVVPKLSDSPGTIRWPGRPLGADNDAVYRALGLSDADLEKLRETGVV